MFIVLAAAATRLLPHPPNVTAITALALFGSAHFSDRRLAIGVPLAALLVSDIALGFYWQWDFRAVQGHMWVQYASFLAIAGMGFLLRQSRSAASGTPIASRRSEKCAAPNSASAVMAVTFGTCGNSRVAAAASTMKTSVPNRGLSMSVSRARRMRRPEV